MALPAQSFESAPAEQSRKANPAAKGGGEFIRRLVAAWVLVNLIVVFMVGLLLSQERDRLEAQAAATAENGAQVAEENLSGFIGRIDLTLLAVADETMRQIAAGGIESGKTDDLLARHDARLPEALGLRLVDAQGIIRHGVSGVMVAQASIADRPQFIYLRDHPRPGLVVSKPVFGRAANKWMITLSRRLDNPDGSFAGDVHVAVTLDRLSELFGRLKSGTHGSVGLWDSSSSLLARYPETEGPGGVVAQAPAPSPQLRQVIAEGIPSAGYHTVSLVDHIERVFYVRRVGSLPLWVVVGVADEDILAEWYRQVALMAGLTVLFLVATTLPSWLVYRGWCQRSAYTAQLEVSRAMAEEARQRNDMVLASAGEGICGIDLDGRITFINPAARRLLGWDEDEGMGESLHAKAHHHHADGRIYPPQDCALNRTLADGQPRQIFEDVHWRKDGRMVKVELTTAAIRADGAVVGGVTVIRDIGARLEAEAAMARNLAITAALGNVLRRSLAEDSLERILEGALREMLALPWLNLENRGCVFLADGADGGLRMVAEWNLPAEIATSCASIAIGQCLCGRAAQENRPIFSGCIEGDHSTGYDGMGDHGHYCIPIRRGDEVLGLLNAYVSHGHRYDSEEERALILVADTLAGIITRKTTEERLRESEDLAKTLMNTSMDAAFMLDRDGILLSVNEALARRIGLPAEAMLGRSLFDLFPPALAAARRTVFEQVLATREPARSLDERDGLRLDNRAHPILDQAGEVARVAVFSRDITEQAKAQQTIEQALTDLARSNEELQQFAYVASHDLREPLRAITGHLQLLQRRLGKTLDGDAQDSMTFVVDGAKRMDLLIRDLLEYSRIGHADRVIAPVDLGALMGEVLSNLGAAQAEAEGEVSVVGDLPVVMGHGGELTRLFQNLIGNAFKYRAPDRPPRVTIAAEPDENGWVISVKDNGIGVEPQHFERIFMIFQRLHGRGQYEGTGIGLAVCRKIVERHGGRLWLDSVPGEGSTFHVMLPRG